MEKIIKKIFFITLFIFSFFLFGEVKVVSKSDNSIKLLYKFDKINIEKVNGYSFIRIEGTEQLSQPGKPTIPIRVAKILIPEGKTIDKINITYNYEKIQGTYNLETAQTPQKIGTNSNYRKLKFSGIFPEKDYLYTGTQIFKGYKISFIQIYPVKYISSTKEIEISKNVYVEISFKESLKKLEKTFISKVRGIKEDIEEVKKLVDNSAYISDYKSRKGSSLGGYKYVVITADELQGSFSSLIASKISSGLSATIVTTDYIYSNFDGVDNQERIRNFIIWAYNNWNTHYVLLGGDVDVVPIRYFYNPVEGSSNPIPTDMYYSNLDGTFDYDNDGIYGEPNDGVGGGDIDFLPEVYVGRAPVDTPEEADNFVNKVSEYVE